MSSELLPLSTVEQDRTRVPGIAPAEEITRGSRLSVHFDHGLGDCVHFAHLVQLYRRRGYEVAVHYEKNKQDLWRTAGVEYLEKPGAPYVPWTYPTTFGDLHAEDTGANKILHNLNSPPLPSLGEKGQLWKELVQIRIRLEPAGEDLQRVEEVMGELPRPWILVHTVGTNFADAKNLAPESTVRLYRLLLDDTGGSLVVLDWDARSPRLPHGRVRNLHELWPHASLAQLAALYHASDLFLGVDSGPFHFTSVTDIPAIGIWRRLVAHHCSIPRGRAVNLVPASWADAIRPRRMSWNMVEYAGQEPAADEIAATARRLLKGPRYLGAGQLGADVALQQMVARSAGSTPLSEHADRHRTFDLLLRHAACFREPRIVEVGCIRSLDDWQGAGNSSYLFACYLAARGCGSLTCIDTAPDHLAFATSVLEPLHVPISFNGARGVEALRSFEQPIDILYLDGSDDPAETEQEAIAAQGALHGGSLVLIDDTAWLDGWRGKGELAVGWLTRHGWKILERGYQVLLARDA